MTINITNDYTKYPGGRFISDGEFSGEDFRQTVLLPAFEACKKNNEQLTVILDGGYGYGPSFLEESFGGLVRQTQDENIRKIIIVSEEEPKLIDDIKQYINEAFTKNKN